MFTAYMIINRNTSEVLKGATVYSRGEEVPLAWSTQKEAEAHLDTIIHGTARQLKVVQVRPLPSE